MSASATALPRPGQPRPGLPKSSASRSATLDVRARWAPERPLLQRLEGHLGSVAERLPERPLLVLFDVDLALLDLSHGLAELLRRFDERAGTRYFEGLLREQLETDEAGLRRLFEARAVPHSARRELHNEFLRLRWVPRAEVGGSLPYLCSLELLRWLEMQPDVDAAFLTERTDDRRDETLQALQMLSADSGLHFGERRLFSAGAAGEHLTGEAHRRAALEHFTARGFQVAALVGEAIGGQEPPADADLLRIDAAALAAELRSGQGSRAPHVLWTGVRDAESLERFVGCSVPFGELGLRRGPSGGIEIEGAGSGLELEEVLAACAQASKGLRLRLAGARALVPRLALALERSSFPGAQLEFASRPEELAADDLLALRERFPEATFVAVLEGWRGLQSFAPDLGSSALLRVRERGYDAASVELQEPGDLLLVEAVEAAGLELDLSPVGGLVEYLAAAARMPRSVRADFLPGERG